MWKNNVALYSLRHQIKTMTVLRLFIFKELISLCAMSLLLSFVNTQKDSTDLSNVSFADINLTFSQGAQKQIEAKISSYQPQPFLDNIHQVESFLDLLDESLQQEKVPADYKYLCLYKFYLQMAEEDKRGFWNLSEQRAESFDLRVDKNVDERFNLLSSTYQVSREMRRNNIYFANWLFNMLTVEMGFQKTRAFVLDNYSRSEIVGKRQWVITEKTHPLIREVIAFKLFIEQRIAPQFQHRVKIKVDARQERKTFKQISADYLVSVEELKLYNPWLRKNRVPSDKIYPVLIPIMQSQEINRLSVNTAPTNLDTPISDQEFVKPTENTTTQDYYSLRKTEDELRAIMAQQEQEYYEEINRKKTVYKLVDNTYDVQTAATHEVLSGQTLYEIARLYNLSVQDLRAYNQLTPYDDIYVGQVLYLRNTNTNQQSVSPSQKIHIVALGENLSAIARKYQVSIQDLINWNQLKNSDYIRVGQKLVIYTSNDEYRRLKTGQSVNTKFTILGQTPKYRGATPTNQRLVRSLEKKSEGPMRGAPAPLQSSDSKLKLLWLPKLKK